MNLSNRDAWARPSRQPALRRVGTGGAQARLVRKRLDAAEPDVVGGHDAATVVGPAAARGLPHTGTISRRFAGLVELDACACVVRAACHGRRFAHAAPYRVEGGAAARQRVRPRSADHGSAKGGRVVRRNIDGPAVLRGGIVPDPDVGAVAACGRRDGECDRESEQRRARKQRAAFGAHVRALIAAGKRGPTRSQ